MHVILRPTTQPDLEPIEVSGALFAIGRQEPPFNDYPGELVAKLSRRHARLFEQDGFVYLADLGSLNGTNWNGRQIKHEPVELRSGDVVEFGGLAFEAEVRVQEPEAPEVPPDGTIQRLVLTPERSKDVLEPIVVSSFPFLFDKSSDVFARHKQTLKDTLAYMSRHHAHIFTRDGELYIEDLGSTNGTFVSGRKLDERARRLRDGDLIALGTERLTYSAHVLRAVGDGTTQMPSGIPAVDNPTRTIFVDSPTSFLDVYFVDDEDDAVSSEADDSSAQEAAGGGAKHAGLAGQLMHSFFGGPVFGAGARRVVAALALLAAAGAGIWYWQGRDVRAIEAAMRQNQYAIALQRAQAHLAQDPDDAAVRELATRAAVLRWVPEWQAAFMATRGPDPAAAALEQARAVLEQARSAVADGTEAQDFVTLLDWSTGLRARLLAEPPADIGERIERARGDAAMLEWWQDDAFTHGRTVDRLAGVLPEFRAAREQIYSDVRDLRSLTLDSQSLLALGDALSGALARGDLDLIRRTVDEFVAEQRQVPGREALAADVDRLTRLEALLADGEWHAALLQLREDPFVTGPFAAHGRELARSRLPDDTAVARLEQAQARWRDGELETALAELRALGEGDWPGFGRHLAQRYAELLDGYRALEQSRGEPGYASRLFDYYAGLDGSRDSHLVAQLELEFRDHAEAAAGQADQYVREAQNAWTAYGAAGGIQPEHRLTPSVSTAFTARAGELSAAREGLARSQRIYQQIGRPLPAAWRELETEVSREAAFQRGQLGNLAFHEPETQRRMLGLLPEPL